MKIRIYETKLDPMYKMCLYNILPVEDNDVSEEFFEKYQKCMKEFEHIQTIIKQIGEDKGYW